MKSIVRWPPCTPAGAGRCAASYSTRCAGCWKNSARAPRRYTPPSAQASESAATKSARRWRLSLAKPARAISTWWKPTAASWPRRAYPSRKSARRGFARSARPRVASEPRRGHENRGRRVSASPCRRVQRPAPGPMTEYGDRYLVGNQREQVSRFRARVMLFVPLAAILFQVYVPRFFGFLGYLELPLLVTIYFALMRRSQIGGLFIGAK